MSTIVQELHSRALELRQQHRNVDLAVLEAALNDGAKIAVARLTIKVRATREQIESDRIKGNNPQ